MLAFEYRDEDGDLVTVRTDQELHAMLNYYVTMTANGDEFHVFPKIVDHMNTFQLKVAISPTLSSKMLDQSIYTEVPTTHGVCHGVYLIQYLIQFLVISLSIAKFHK